MVQLAADNGAEQEEGKSRALGTQMNAFSSQYLEDSTRL